MVKLILSKTAIDDLIEAAKKGYEAKWKKEAGGHLLGRRNGRDFYVRKAIIYNTPGGKRTSWAPNPDCYERKGRKLEETIGLRWIGTFHSHVEVNGSSSSRPSKEDRDEHRASPRPVEIIVNITNQGRKYSPKCLSYKLYDDGYCCDIGGFIKDSRGIIKRIKVLEKRRRKCA